MVVSVAAFILALVGIVILTVAAGRNNEDEKVHLNFFDRWYTEIAAGMIVVIWLMGLSILMQAMDSEEMLDNLGSH